VIRPCCEMASFVILMLPLLVGCTKTTDKVEVAGNVSWDGSPLPSGSIRFLPFDRTIAPAGGKIVDGAYKFFCKPTKMRVEIEATRLTGKIDPIEKAPIGEQFIPARYNQDSELSADVTRDGTNRFDFSLSPTADR
jgi:hypothetical protein